MLRTSRGDSRLSRHEAEALAAELWTAAQVARKAEVRGEGG